MGLGSQRGPLALMELGDHIRAKEPRWGHRDQNGAQGAKLGNKDHTGATMRSREHNGDQGTKRGLPTTRCQGTNKGLGDHYYV